LLLNMMNFLNYLLLKVLNLMLERLFLFIILCGFHLCLLPNTRNPVLLLMLQNRIRIPVKTRSSKSEASLCNLSPDFIRNLSLVEIPGDSPWHIQKPEHMWVGNGLYRSCIEFRLWSLQSHISILFLLKWPRFILGGW